MTKSTLLVAIAISAFALFADGAQAPAQTAPTACPEAAGKPMAWLDTTLTAECRADALVSKLSTLDEKLQAIGGSLRQYGLYDIVGGDGPAGPTVVGALAMPNPLALAATFDMDLAGAYGLTVARENRAAGRQRALGPVLDIARVWQHGRIPEAMGEDPFLAGQLSIPYLKQGQSQGVSFTLKHYTAYTQEQGRTGDQPYQQFPAGNNVVSNRVLRQIYMAPFRSAVEDGGALGIMCSFPRINGTYSCENPYTLGALKKEWGLRGSVGPDFPSGQRSVIAAVNAGLDSGNFGLPRGGGAPPGLPGAPGVGPVGAGGPPAGATGPGALAAVAASSAGGIPGGVTLKDAVLQGKVSEARVADMVRRRLIAMFAVGAGTYPSAPLGVHADARGLATALQVTEASSVLLRNEYGILPFGPNVKSIALIGPQAGPKAKVNIQGAAYVNSNGRFVPAIDGIRARAGRDVMVTYEQGPLAIGEYPVIPAEVLRAPSGEAGLRAQYYANNVMRFAGATFADRIEPGVNMLGAPKIDGLPPYNRWSALWTGKLTPRKTGVHEFSIAGAASAKLFVNGKQISHFDRIDFGTVTTGTIALTAGKAIDLRLEYTPRQAAGGPGNPLLNTTLGTLMRLGWAEPDDRIAKAVAAAKAADVAVVFVGDQYGEGNDRMDLSLPGDQDEVIEAVAAANPRTVVVLTTAGAVKMPWLSKVSGVIEMWYPGELFGRAVSRLLFGDASPGGRLPVTFPMNEKQGPGVAQRNYPGVISADGAIDNVYFDEGLNVGYRWWDAHHQTPLFPFGYGLTYSPTTISNVAVADDGQGAKVRAEVKNVGARDETEIVQVYARLPAAAKEPPRRLVGFMKVALKPGERRTVVIAVAAKDLQIWDEATEAWRLPTGRYVLEVGKSSRSIVWQGSVDR